jgi:hypothetical protein
MNWNEMYWYGTLRCQQIKVFFNWITFRYLFYILGLTLDCNNFENGNWFTEISKINYYKNDPKQIFSL